MHLDVTDRHIGHASRQAARSRPPAPACALAPQAQLAPAVTPQHGGLPMDARLANSVLGCGRHALSHGRAQASRSEACHCDADQPAALREVQRRQVCARRQAPHGEQAAAAALREEAAAVQLRASSAGRR